MGVAGASVGDCDARACGLWTSAGSKGFCSTGGSVVGDTTLTVVLDAGFDALALLVELLLLIGSAGWSAADKAPGLFPG